MSKHEGWINACAVTDLESGEALRLDTSPPIAVFNVDGEFFATSDTCTHGQSSLSEGYVEDDCSVECIAHMARFDLRTGAVLAPPATLPIAVYDTEVRDGRVFVDGDQRS